MHVNFNRPVFEVCGVVAMREQTGESVGRALKQDRSIAIVSRKFPF